MSEPWFTVKTYGMGVRPRNAKGWIATFGFIVGCLAIPILLIWFHAPRVCGPLFLGALAVSYISLVSSKSDGNPWHWRWGRR